jgi:TRAP-type C4-dicarboxylate transport system permease small subunit
MLGRPQRPTPEPDIVNALRELLRPVVRAADHAAGWLLLAICALNLAAVVMRYGFRDSIPWSEEAIRYLAVWMTFLGSASAAWLDEHMDMNLFSGIANARFQSWHRAGLQLLTVAFGVIVCWQGVIYVRLNGLQTAPSTGLPMFWIYSAIAVGGLLLTLVALVKLVDAFVPPPRDAEGRPQL